jgi:hypothetical protein
VVESETMTFLWPGKAFPLFVFPAIVRDIGNAMHRLGLTIGPARNTINGNSHFEVGSMTLN